MTKLSTEVSEELEALQSIFEADYQERPPVWNYPSFAIRIRSATNPDHQAHRSSVTVQFQLSASYPKTGPKYEIQETNGLSGEEKRRLALVTENAIKDNLNCVMIYEIVSAIQNFLDTEVQCFQAETFYDAMLRREQEQSAYIQNLKNGGGENILQPHTNVVAPVNNPSHQQKNSTDSNAFGGRVGIISSVSNQIENFVSNTPAISSVPATPSVSISAKIPNELNAISAKLQNRVTEATTKKEETFIGDDDSDEDCNSKNSNSLFYDNSKSRYSQEFQEMNQIGNGASGEVWKVRHKLDRRIYAVKKIDLNARNNAVGSKIQREVTTISRLIHKNIVRYYAAWIEQYEATFHRPSDPKSSCEKNSLSKSNSGNIWVTGNAFMREVEKDAWGGSRNDNFAITFENSHSENMDLSNFGINHTIRPLYNFDSSSDESESSDDNESDSESDDTSDHSLADDKDLFGSDSDSRSSESAESRIARWMFIQMEYCCTTLRAEIDKGQLWMNQIEINRLLRQMLEALAYMHKCKVIHRDLKPANIFLDAENNIKVGDFGLATTGNNREYEKSKGGEGSFILESSENSVHIHQEASVQSGNQDAIDSLTAGIGTALYRAPEQEAVVVTSSSNTGEQHVVYNEKADIYSLGIILFEMCSKPFETGMERLVTIKELRENGNFPSGFEKYAPVNLIRIISWLTQKNPEHRPSAVQLLNSELMPARADVDSQYLKEITEALYKPNSAASLEILSILFDSDNKFTTLETVQNSIGLADYQNRSLLYDYAMVERIESILNPRPSLVFKSGLGGNQLHSKIQCVTQKMIVPLHYLNAAKRRLRSIFEARGAVDFYSQLFELKSSAKATLNDKLREELVELMDPSGQVVILQPDLLNTFTRIIAFLNISSSQRFCFDRVFTKEFSSERIYSQPITVDNAVYDVVMPAHDDSYILLADVEVIGTVKSILTSFQSSLPPTALRLSHSLIEEVIISICCWEGERSMKEVKVSAETNMKIKQLLSQAVECSDVKDVEAFVVSSNLSTAIQSRLLPIARALMHQDITGPHDPFLTIHALENEFYGLKEVAFSNLAVVDMKEKDLSKSKDKIFSQEKDKIVKVGGKFHPTADFTPISLDHIGIKAKTNKEQFKVPIPSSEEKFKRERAASIEGNSGNTSHADIVKEWANKFERGLQYLKDVLRLVALQKAVKDMCNANYSRDLGRLSSLEKDLNLRSSNIIIDLGIDSLTSPFFTRPYFQSEGMRFIVESYTTVSSSLKNVASTVPGSSSRRGTKQKEVGSKVQSEHQNMNSTLVYRRFKRNIGYWMDGGHFEKLIYERRYQLCGRHDSTHKVTACGLRVHMENLISVIHKTESRNRSKSVNVLPHAITKVSTHQKSFGNSEKLVALVVNGNKYSKGPGFDDDSSSIFFGPQYKLHLKSLVVVTNWLQSHHIRSSYNIHQLQGYMSLSVVELCRQLDIPVLVSIDGDNYEHVEVHMLNHQPGSNPQSVPLQKLPNWIKFNVSEEYFQYPIHNCNIAASEGVVSTSGPQGKTDASLISSQQADEDNGTDRVIATNVVTPTSFSDNELFGNKKKKKDFDLMVLRLSSAFATLTGAERLIFKSISDVLGKAKPWGIVQVVEIPLSILRNINTLIMTKSAIPSVFKTEFDILISHESTSAYRKTLKHYLTALINLSQSLISTPQFGNNSSLPKYLSGINGKSATIAKHSSGLVTKQLIFTFTPLDEYLDSLVIVVEQIMSLRAIL